MEVIHEPNAYERAILSKSHLNADKWRVVAKYGNTLEVIKNGNCQRRVLKIGVSLKNQEIRANVMLRRIQR